MAENADFADICRDHHIKFNGPTSVHIYKMGDKASARATMRTNGVPVTPGPELI